jgi:hypothetical protein
MQFNEKNCVESIPDIHFLLDLINITEKII